MSASPLGRALAVPVVVAAALRLATIERRCGVEELVERMRTARRLPDALSDPRLYPPVVDRLIRWLPPYRRLGRCVKRSLLLLRLWSRCGLCPVFHYGVALGEDGTRKAHAWLSDVERDLPTGGSGDGFVETLAL